MQRPGPGTMTPRRRRGHRPDAQHHCPGKRLPYRLPAHTYGRLFLRHHNRAARAAGISGPRRRKPSAAPRRGADAHHALFRRSAGSGGLLRKERLKEEPAVVHDRKARDIRKRGGSFRPAFCAFPAPPRVGGEAPYSILPCRERRRSFLLRRVRAVEPGAQLFQYHNGHYARQHAREREIHPDTREPQRIERSDKQHREDERRRDGYERGPEAPFLSQAYSSAWRTKTSALYTSARKCAGQSRSSP